MDDKPLVWLRYGLAIILILTLAFGAYAFLSAGSAQRMTLWQFIPTGIAAGLWVLVELYVSYEISTWLCIILIAVSFILFYFAFIEANPERKAGLFGFAGAVFGFATGMPIGHFNSTRRKSHCTPQNIHANSINVNLL